MKPNTAVNPLREANQSITPVGKKYSKNYKRFFKEITGFDPLPFQVKYHQKTNEHGYKALSVPTGLGKTVTVLVDWLYRRIHSPSETPRRLFYVVPLRTLVTQLTEVIRDITERSGIDIPVYKMMGGDLNDDWVEHPEQPAIVISTLDQLVSRQLLRPYTSSIKSSLMHFAATQDDCTIVLDESQLMTQALGTSVVLHELMLQQASFHNRELVLCSATNNTSLVDKKTFQFDEITLGRGDYRHKIGGAKVNNKKSLHTYPKLTDDEIVELAEDRHKDNGLTLIITNTVKRAQSIYSTLKRKDKILLHSRFRKADRTKIEAQIPSFRGIVVSTSCIECGVDISADVLITELAPWSSLVQRGGRVARLPNTEGEVHIVKSNKILPYKQVEIDAAANRLMGLKDFSIKQIMSVPPVESANRKPNEIDLEFLKRMFDPRNTEAISQYVRDVNMPTCYIAWRYPRNLGIDMPKLDALEKCPLYTTQLIEIINRRKDVWIVDEEKTAATRPFKTVWRQFDIKTDKIQPGIELCVGTAAKNYSAEMGLLVGCRKRVKQIKEKSPKRSNTRGGYGDDSKNAALGLIPHLYDTKNFAKRICADIDLRFSEFSDAVILAALLHDLGKACITFQKILGVNGEGDPSNRDEGRPLAKADFYIKDGPAVYGDRAGFRHEMPGALALLELDAKDPLVMWLIAQHHGQVTGGSFRSMKEWADTEKMICGVCEGDYIPAMRGSWARDIKKPDWIKADKGYFFPKVVFKDPNSYVKAYREAFDECWEMYGPVVMSYLGTLVRCSDHRASEFREAPDNDED